MTFSTIHAFEGLNIYGSPEEDQRRYELRSLVDSINLATFPEPKGLQFGKLKFNPYMTLDEAHTDNSRRTPDHELVDDLVSYDVGFTSLFRPMECVRATLNYDFGWHDYVRGTLRDFLSHQATCQVQVDRVGVQGLSLRFTDLYTLTSNISELENELVQSEKFQFNRTEMRAQYQYDRLTISGAYNYSFLDYAPKDFSGSDFRAQSGVLEFAWKWLPERLEIFDSFQISRTLFDHVRELDFDADTFLSGVRGRYSKLTYSVGVGYAFSRPLFKVGTTGDIGYTGTIGYSPHSRITTEVSGRRSFVASVRLGSTLETNVTASLKVLLTRRGTYNLSYTHNESDQLSGVTQTSVGYTSRFEYKLLRRAAISAVVARFERRSSFKPAEFNIDEVRLNFRLSW